MIIEKADNNYSVYVPDFFIGLDEMENVVLS